MKFGDWTTQRKEGTPTRGGRRTWSCVCICGTIRDVAISNLHGGKSLGCGCTKKGLRLRPYEAMYRLLLRESQGRYEVSLSYEEFINFVGRSCHYCGSQVLWIKFAIAGRGGAYHLDRKNNDKGYSKENCVVCCSRCNRGKGADFTYREWKQIGRLISSWTKD